MHRECKDENKTVPASNKCSVMLLWQPQIPTAVLEITDQKIWLMMTHKRWSFSLHLLQTKQNQGSHGLLYSHLIKKNLHKTILVNYCYLSAITFTLYKPDFLIIKVHCLLMKSDIRVNNKDLECDTQRSLPDDSVVKC